MMTHKPPLTHCHAGHLFCKENTRIETMLHPNGKLYKTRRCRKCQSTRVNAYLKLHPPEAKPVKTKIPYAGSARGGKID